jgi:hypothetical protein
MSLFQQLVDQVAANIAAAAENGNLHAAFPSTVPAAEC